MKKFLALLLTLVMALSLAACGGSDEESTDSPAEDPAANEESSGSAADRNPAAAPRMSRSV